MASVNLSTLRAAKPQATIDDLDPNVAPGYEYKYKDVKLDLEYNAVNNNLADDTSASTRDLMDLIDIHDIKQSLYNLFNTMPGQKLLNPNYGLNLAHFCFEPITHITADHIARTIILEVPKQEPRIDIQHLVVEGDIDNNTYNITFNLHVPDADISARVIKGLVNSDGFKFEQG